MTDKDIDARIAGNRTNNEMINGMLYQRKVQKNAELAKKRRMIKAILQKKRDKVKAEHEQLAAEGGDIKSKNMSFYDKVF
jgi:hypothetical protein